MLEGRKEFMRAVGSLVIMNANTVFFLLPYPFHFQPGKGILRLKNLVWRQEPVTESEAEVFGAIFAGQGKDKRGIANEEMLAGDIFRDKIAGQ